MRLKLPPEKLSNVLSETFSSALRVIHLLEHKVPIQQGLTDVGVQFKCFFVYDIVCNAIQTEFSFQYNDSALLMLLNWKLPKALIFFATSAGD